MGGLGGGLRPGLGGNSGGFRSTLPSLLFRGPLGAGLSSTGLGGLQGGLDEVSSFGSVSPEGVDVCEAVLGESVCCDESIET